MVSELGDRIVAIDIGTTKICTIVAQILSSNKLELLAIGPAKSEGLKKGTIVDIEKTVESLEKSLAKVKAEVTTPITKAIVSIAGNHIYSFNHSAMVALRSGVVTQRDINRVLSMAKAITLPHDRTILHVIPQEFKVDDLGEIENPLGMSGKKLEAKVHVVTGAIPSIENLKKCIERVGLQVEEVILQPVASSESVLTDEEKEMGVVLIDIGGGTTDIVVWQGGVPLYSRVIPVGGTHFSYDLMMALHIPYAEAEAIKKNHGRVVSSESEENCQIKLGTNKEIPLRFISKILGLRAEELLLTVKGLLEEKKIHQQIHRYVFTGGGALLGQFEQLAHYVLEREVRIGYPKWKGSEENLTNPQLATVIGLVNLAHKYQSSESSKIQKKQWDLMNRLNQSLRNVFKEIF